MKKIIEKIKNNILLLTIIGAIMSKLLVIGLLVAIWYELYIANCFYYD